ncbi:MAG: hypothetical protein HKM06_03800 [Spirochaetales bacterium]|nr:hypothetical protein [Spirochaetales bacterium]
MNFQTDRRIIIDGIYFIREALFACTDPVQLECAVSFARFLNWSGINRDTYPLFLRLIQSNNPWVIDALIDAREPRLLFSTIKPHTEMIESAFSNLFAFHPDELYEKALMALLGIVENAYFDADDGYKLHPIGIMDINAVGKFLIKAEPQEHPINRLVLQILDRLTHLGESYRDPEKNILAKHAFNVRYAYFDTTKQLNDAIPKPILTRKYGIEGVDPHSDYAEVLRQRQLERQKARRIVPGEETPGIQ